MIIEEYGIKYWTSTPPVKGVFKKYPEDFIVEEISVDGKKRSVKYAFLERIKDFLPKKPRNKKEKYVNFTLVKRNYTTQRALEEISKRMNVSPTRFDYAGTKDKIGITSQSITGFKVDLKKLKKIRIKDLQLKNFSYSKKRLRLGDLKGNCFRIRLRETNATKEIMEEFKKEIQKGLPNYFGPQRFGIQRKTNYLVGRAMINDDYKKAVKIFLTKTGDESEEATRARENLKKNWNKQGFKKALEEYPKYLGIERSVIQYLSRNQEDYLSAMKRIPRKLRLMFVHSVQSYLFNNCLSKYSWNDVPEYLPLIGYKSEEIPEEMKKILEKEKIEPQDFRTKLMPEMSLKGGERKTMIKVRNFKYKLKKRNLILSFCLNKGAYATTVINELTKNLNNN